MHDKFISGKILHLRYKPGLKFQYEKDYYAKIREKYDENIESRTIKTQNSIWNGNLNVIQALAS